MSNSSTTDHNCNLRDSQVEIKLTLISPESQVTPSFPSANGKFPSSASTSTLESSTQETRTTSETSAAPSEAGAPSKSEPNAAAITSAQNLRRSSSNMAASAFTEDQMTELRASFEECDIGKTGFISVGDLESVVETLGMNITEEAIMEMIDKFDLKKSGEIDFDEFVEMMASTRISQLSEEEEIRMIFRVFDRNKTGFIDVDELRSVMKDLGESISEDDLDAMMKEADVAGNGVISYEEFLLMFKNSSSGAYKEKKKTGDTFCCCS